jgi:hypothetical protein
MSREVFIHYKPRAVPRPGVTRRGGDNLDQGRKAAARTRRPGWAMSSRKHKPGRNWRWLFRRTGSPAVLEQREDVGLVATEHAAVEFLAAFNTAADRGQR